MKRIIITLLLLVLTSTVCFAQKMLYFDGISFDKTGWGSFQTHRKTTGIADGSSSISGSKSIPYVGSFSINIEKVKSDGSLSLLAFTENLQEETINNAMESLNSGASKLKIEPKSNVEDTEINGIKAKYFDFKYKLGIGSAFQRTYCLEKDGYIITIMTTSGTWNIKTHNKYFSKILKSFRFDPE